MAEPIWYPDPDYLPVMTLVMYSITLLCDLTSIYLMSYLLFCVYFRRNRLKVDSFSTSMRIYFFSHVICATLSAITLVYVVACWRRDGSGYNVDVFFFMGITLLNKSTVAPLPVFFLTVERCLALKASLSNYEKYQSYLVYSSILAIVGAYVLSTFIFLLELPLDYDKVKTCGIFLCYCIKYKGEPQFYIKIVVSTADFFFSFYFFSLLQRNYSRNIKNRVVRLTIIVEISLSIIPSYLNEAIAIIFQRSPVKMVGPCAVMLQAVEALVCGAIYSLIFLKCFQRKHSQTRTFSVTHSKVIIPVVS